MSKTEQVKWTYEETERLIALISKGLKPTQIGKEMNRTKDSVRHRIRFLEKKPKLRPEPIKEVKKEEKRQEKKVPKPVEVKKYKTVEKSSIEWCPVCHAPVSSWEQHIGRLGWYGCKKPAFG